MVSAMEGARYFFHVAADYRLWAPDPREIERNNLQGAQATMGAALKCGVERVVYTSSVAALEAGPIGGGRNFPPYAAKRDRRVQAQQAGGRARSRAPGAGSRAFPP